MILLTKNMLLLLWFIPVIVFLYLYAYKMRKRALRVFADKAQFSKLQGIANHKFRFYKGVLIILSFVCIVFALARPNWGEKKEEQVERTGRDIIFMLDVSRSMLAADIKPNRLERAKLAIKDVVASLNGDRVALVAFAGDNALLCPLTLDYGFFKLILDDAGAHSVSRGGTLIGDALRMVMSDVIDKQDTKFKDIILITDGEDHESFPVEAASEAGKRGIRLFTIGFGSDTDGERIPVNDERNQHNFVKYNGQEVWSKLDSATLRQMANATPNGRYLHVATGAIDLGEVYKELTASAEKQAVENGTVTTTEEHFQIFIAMALLLALIELFIPERRKVS